MPQQIDTQVDVLGSDSREPMRQDWKITEVEADLSRSKIALADMGDAGCTTWRSSPAIRSRGTKKLDPLSPVK